MIVYELWLKHEMDEMMSVGVRTQRQNKNSSVGCNQTTSEPAHFDQ